MEIVTTATGATKGRCAVGSPRLACESLRPGSASTVPRDGFDGTLSFITKPSALEGAEEEINLYLVELREERTGA